MKFGPVQRQKKEARMKANMAQRMQEVLGSDMTKTEDGMGM